MAPNKKKIIVALSVVIAVLAIVFIVFSLLSKNKSSLPAPVQKTVEKVETIFNRPGSTVLIKPTTNPLAPKTTLEPLASPTPGVNTLYEIPTAAPPTPTLKVADPAATTPEDYLSFANTVTKWLDGQKNTVGIYNWDVECDVKTNNCQSIGPDHRVGVVAVWGKFKYYTRRPSSELITSIDKDTQVLLDSSKIEEIQNDFWNCKLMYDIYQSKAITQAFKNRARDICKKGTYTTDPDIQKLNSDVTTTKPQDPNMTDLLAGRQITIAYDKTVANFMKYSTFASDFATKYMWFKESGDLLRAKNYFARAAAIYSSKQPLQSDISFIGIASLDLYKATSQADYLTFAKQIYTTKQTQGCRYLASCIYYAEFVKEMYDITKDKQYQTKEAEFLNHMIQSGYDLTGFKGFIKGSGAIRSYDEPEIYIYSVQYNAILLNLFSSFNSVQ